ncbi:MAG: HDOD domain-containing protein [bacterium]|nr:HDOD domain-containing protein [bacterium]
MAVETENKECRAELEHMLLEIEELPTIPETLVEILRIIDEPTTGASDLAQIVRLDPPLSAKILRLANSPFYGAGREVADIGRCIAVLGYRTMRNVAITLTVASNLLSAVSRTNGRLDYREIWRHSVITGAIAKHLAALAHDSAPEEIFAAGLLHDIGKFVLALHAPERYDAVVAERAESRRPLSDVEQEHFGFDHADVGAAFAESWRLPEILTRCVGQHHLLHGPATERTPRSERASAIVALGDHLAHVMERPTSDLGGDPSLQQPARLHEAAGVPQSLVEASRDGIRESISMATVFVKLT